jgi:hypothetical protein
VLRVPQIEDEQLPLRERLEEPLRELASHAVPSGQMSTDGTSDEKRPTDRSGRPARPPCPSCGSAHTQPFTHGGPAARLNMKCIDCGHLFKEQRRAE